MSPIGAMKPGCSLVYDQSWGPTALSAVCSYPRGMCFMALPFCFNGILRYALLKLVPFIFTISTHISVPYSSEEVTYSQVTKRVCCTPFHLTLLFGYICGIYHCHQFVFPSANSFFKHFVYKCICE